MRPFGNARDRSQIPGSKGLTTQPGGGTAGPDRELVRPEVRGDQPGPPVPADTGRGAAAQVFGEVVR